MAGVWHAVWLVGIGAAAGFALVNALCLLRLALDVLAAGDVGECSLWPDPCSLTVWTGTDWATVTVIPVAFGRWGVALCRDRAPRRAGPFELVHRTRSEAEALGRARLLAGQLLRGWRPSAASAAVRVR
jgi:hypothetical protein